MSGTLRGYLQHECTDPAGQAGHGGQTSAAGMAERLMSVSRSTARTIIFRMDPPLLNRTNIKMLEVIVKGVIP